MSVRLERLPKLCGIMSAASAIVHPDSRSMQMNAPLVAEAGDNASITVAEPDTHEEVDESSWDALLGEAALCCEAGRLTRAGTGALGPQGFRFEGVKYSKTW